MLNEVIHMKPSRHMVVERECCGTCLHYHQHYVLAERGRPYPLWYGHCTAPRSKRRMPDEVCEYWKCADKDEDGA